jgi:hypothetical protein
MKKAVMLWLLLGAPALAGGWRTANTEGECDIAYARSLNRLDCAALNQTVEWQRQVVNQRVYSAYNRRLLETNSLPPPTVPAVPSPFAP